MQNDIVRDWFDSDFSDLDPLLQKLHVVGGELTGNIDISYGSGLAGLIGKRLAKKLQKSPKERQKNKCYIFQIISFFNGLKTYGKKN